ncbi:hypothetical protein QYF36_010399 [Acer negundo]|nr:hypothetical protein QYF36_010399 [Acer negundo]
MKKTCPSSQVHAAKQLKTRSLRSKHQENGNQISAAADPRGSTADPNQKSTKTDTAIHNTASSTETKNHRRLKRRNQQQRQRRENTTEEELERDNPA